MFVHGTRYTNTVYGLIGVPVVKYYIKIKYTPAVRSKILSKLIFASRVRYTDRAYYWEYITGNIV